MCDKNFEYFNDNFQVLREEYADKFLVIKDQGVIGIYDSFDEAYSETIQKEKIGTFLIQLCRNDETTVNQFYSSNVVFS